MTAVPEFVERIDRSWLMFTVRLAVRFWTGRDLTGDRKTTATFLRPGDALGPHEVWWFQHHPGHRRARFRALSTLTVALLVYLDLTSPTLFWWLVAAVAVVAVPSLGIALWTWAGNAQHRRRFGVELERWGRETWGYQFSVSVPRTHLDDPDHPAVLQFPAGTAFSETQKAAVAKKAADKLGLTDYQDEWDMVGRPVLRISTAPLPPQRVNITDKGHLFTASEPGRIYIGEGSRGREVFADLDQESPHLLVSGPTGRGKSVLFRGAVAQLLHDGGILSVWDVKRISHMWAKDLPNAEYCRDPGVIHDAAIAIAHEVERRNHIADEHADINGDVDPAVVGPRIGILMEEINATQAMLAKYWRSIRTSDDPVKSPAVEALHNILFMGRAVYVHVFAAGQQVTAHALGGGSARENFGTRILMGATANTWKMLAPECAVKGKFPAASPIRGRVHVVVSGEPVLTQVAWWTNAECRAYAMSGRVVDYRDAVQGRTVLRVESQVRRDETPMSRQLTGLREAHEQHKIGKSVDALRRASTGERKASFPDPVETFGDKNLYDLDELREWERNRVRPREVSRS